MTQPSITIRQADAADVERVEELLSSNDLPYRDVRAKPDSFFVGACDGEDVCVGGVEIRGSTGLLRSVVVEEPARGRGFGAALCEELEEYARENDVGTLYLLTTTASGFFGRCGYGETARDEAPPSIQRTTEFEDLCPDSAICMRKDLS